MKRINVTDDMKPLISYLAVGLDDNLKQQLITKSREPHILQNTPNDAAKRFGNEAMLDTWLKKGREIHCLLGANDDLAGIMWYGHEAFPLDIALPEIPQETFAIRLYEGYIGHHLSQPFMELSFQTYIQGKRASNEPVVGIWLQTDVGNEAARKAYAKFGFREVHRDIDRITMVIDSVQLMRYNQ